MIVLMDAGTDLTPDTRITVQLVQFPHRPKDKFEVRILTAKEHEIQKNTKRFRDFQAAKQAYKMTINSWGLWDGSRL